METIASQLLEKRCREMLESAIERNDLRRTQGDLSDDILRALEERFAERDWGSLCQLVWIVQCFPDHKFTPLLCTLFDNFRAHVDMESIADAFLDLNDERSVPSLIRALDHHLVGDDLAFHFNKKVIYALARIGTSEALEGINLALTSSEPAIRRAAKRELEIIDGNVESAS
jgi:hypothetical protein